MTDYLIFSDFEGKKVVGYHYSASSGSGLSDSSVKDIIIPSSVEGIDVVEVGYSAFCGTGITSIFIPKTIEYINRMCFNSCVSLKTLSFEENSRLNKIDINVFCYCSSLETLDLPSSLTELERPGYSQFYDNKAMICLSYLGASVFPGSYVISSYNSSLIVHTLPSYTGNFGTIIPTRDGIRCATFPIVIYLSNQVEFKCSFHINFSYIHVALNSLVFLIIS